MRCELKKKYVSEAQQRTNLLSKKYKELHVQQLSSARPPGCVMSTARLHTLVEAMMWIRGAL